MKIGDRVLIKGIVDEIRKDVVIIKNDGGYFGTVQSEILDKYAERQKCDTCYHNKTEFSVCQYCTDGDKYEEAEQKPCDDAYDKVLAYLKANVDDFPDYHEAIEAVLKMKGGE